jgi:hypothetical protein
MNRLLHEVYFHASELANNPNYKMSNEKSLALAKYIQDKIDALEPMKEGSLDLIVKQLEELLD